MRPIPVFLSLSPLFKVPFQKQSLHQTNTRDVVFGHVSNVQNVISSYTFDVCKSQIACVV